MDVGSGFAFGSWSLPGGGEYGPVHRPYATLLMVHAGAARVEVDGRTVSVVAGECALVVNRERLAITYQRHLRSEVSWCEAQPRPPVPPRSDGDAGAPDGAAPPPPRKTPITPRLNRLQTMGLDLGDGSGAELNALRNALGLAVFAAYALETASGAAHGALPSAVARARDHVEQNFADEALALPAIAAAAGLTPSYLVGLFRQHLGTTPVRYLWSVRAREARRLLLISDLTSAEIAYRCGYKSPFHFSRHLKSSFGQTPRAIREAQGYRTPSNLAEDAHDLAY